MSRTRPIKLAPARPPPGERQAFVASTLHVFRTRGNLVGGRDVARALVSDMAAIEVAVVAAGHLMAPRSRMQSTGSFWTSPAQIALALSAMRTVG